MHHIPFNKKKTHISSHRPELKIIFTLLQKKKEPESRISGEWTNKGHEGYHQHSVVPSEICPSSRITQMNITQKQMEIFFRAKAFPVENPWRF